MQDGWTQSGAGASDMRVAGQDLQHNRQTRTADEAMGPKRTTIKEFQGGGPMKEHMEHHGHMKHDLHHHLEMEKARHVGAKEHAHHHMTEHHTRHPNTQHGHGGNHKQHYGHQELM